MQDPSKEHKPTESQLYVLHVSSICHFEGIEQ